jgi:hypothetical protein
MISDTRAQNALGSFCNPIEIWVTQWLSNIHLGGAAAVTGQTSVS